MRVSRYFLELGKEYILYPGGNFAQPCESRDGIWTKLRKIEAIQKMIEQQNLTRVGSFLGFITF